MGMILLIIPENLWLCLLVVDCLEVRGYWGTILSILHQTVISTTLVVSLPKMSITFTAILYLPFLG